MSKTANSSWETTGKPIVVLTVISLIVSLLLALVNDVLDMAQLENGTVVLRRESMNLDEVCGSITNSGLFQAEAAGLTVIVHVILGLPDETKAQMLDTVRYLADFQPAIDGIKLQLLHILRGTKLAELYEQAPFPVFSMDEYIELLIECIRLLPPDMVIHRISGDGPKKLLVAPEWSGNKRAFLNTFSKALRESGCFQGQDFTN